MSVAQTRYVVITPVRDEEAYLRSTIESMVGQTIKPVQWVIVNDGSTDGTGRLIDECAAQYPWVLGLHRDNRGFRKSGGGVVEAFNDGLRWVTCEDWEFIVKLDGDLTFAHDYFQTCFEIFQSEPQLGVGGGVICYVENGVKRFEECPAFHVRGATKIYRRACWEAIGGFWVAPGWDTIDEVKANMLGWNTRSFGDLHLVHHRETGSADGAWGGLVKNGRANYISGYHPVFMLAKCMSRAVGHGQFHDSTALLYGFITGYLKRIPQVDDPQMISYIRKQQLRRLVGLPSIWK